MFQKKTERIMQRKLLYSKKIHMVKRAKKWEQDNAEHHLIKYSLLTNDIIIEYWIERYNANIVSLYQELNG